jgi:ABC-type transport system involved in multi-copper enzyme maturation permease subunit
VNLPTAILTVRWLVYDTFRQSLASRLFWVMLGASAVCIAVCFSVGVEGGLPPAQPDEPREFLSPAEAAKEAARARSGVPTDELPVPSGKLTLGFGLIKDIPLARDRSDPVRFLQVWLAGFVADTAGILLALIWTASFLPTFLEPTSVSVLLAKPVPRWSLLVGKYLGVLAFVLFQAVVFVGGTWLALGVRTGVWEPLYLLCVPMLLIHFAVFFSFSALLAVATRNAAACVIGTLFFWMICWGLNYGRHIAALNLSGQTISPAGKVLLEIGYWLLPKPWDLNALVFRGIEGDNFFGRLIELDKLIELGQFFPVLSVLASLGFAVATLALAAYEFVTTDY